MFCLKTVLYITWCIQFLIYGSSQTPNIVFILADDLGWNDVSFHGSKQIPTPNIDALAYDGILLSNYYVQPICTPTRSALMTGRHPIHLGLQKSVIVGSAPYGLGLSETIMPQYLKKLGYKTHIVGKWHLGFFSNAHTPTERGFDSHFGYYQGMEDYYDHSYQATPIKGQWGLDFRRNGEIVKTAFGQYSTELFTREAESIIRDHDSSKPLFLYLAEQAVHSSNSWSPLEAPEKYYRKFSHIQDKNRRRYAAMVSALDDSVGNVTKALHEKGILNDTIIVFSTDNGGPAAGFDWNHASNAPLRGVKDSLWEGGMRGTGFIWSPLLLKSGYTSHHMMQVFDWLPTLLHAAGYDMHSLPRNLDGIDQWDVLSLNMTAVRTEMLHNIEKSSGEKALRVESMKLVSCREGTTVQWDKWYRPEQFYGIETTSNVTFWDYTDEESIRQVSEAAAVVETVWQKTYDTATLAEVAPADMFKSELDHVLLSLGRRPRDAPKPFVVECGERPANFSSNCDVSKAPCLFNIESDPCEYNNLAQQLPDVLHRLLARADAYERTAVPERNKPQDPAGLPVFHNGIWEPWIKDDL